jgi:hypothetical protein
MPAKPLSSSGGRGREMRSKPRYHLTVVEQTDEPSPLIIHDVDGRKLIYPTSDLKPGIMIQISGPFSIVVEGWVQIEVIG